MFLAYFQLVKFSTYDIEKKKIQDRAWTESIAAIAQKTGCDVLPLYFEGGNRKLFHFLGMINPRLRTLTLPREFMKAKNKELKIRIGSLISNKHYEKFNLRREIADYFQFRTSLLGERKVRKSLPPVIKFLSKKKTTRKTQPLAKEVNCEFLKSEVENLPQI